MTDFGDFDDDDAVDVEPPDPEQVARRLHLLRTRERLEAVAWDDLDLAVRVVLIAIAADVLAWMARQGSTP